MENAVKLFSQVHTAQSFQVNIEYYNIIFQLIYHRICKKYLFYLWSCKKLQQTKTSTQIEAIPHILCWDLPCGRLNLAENLTKSGVSVRKKNGLLTLSIQ